MSKKHTRGSNRQMLACLRGERQWYDEAGRRRREVRLVDFQNPGSSLLRRTLDQDVTMRAASVSALHDHSKTGRSKSGHVQVC